MVALNLIWKVKNQIRLLIEGGFWLDQSASNIVVWQLIWQLESKLIR